MAEFVTGLSIAGQSTQSQNPIYDTCEFCRLPIRPGESHGILVPDADGDPTLKCKILRLELVESEVPVQHPASALAGRGR